MALIGLATAFTNVCFRG